MVEAGWGWGKGQVSWQGGDTRRFTRDGCDRVKSESPGGEGRGRQGKGERQAMPTLEFKGKQHVYAHHMTLPYRPLVSDAARSLNPTGVDDNLIVHGDNLDALKALLPRYAGRVKCIYIDPPYNTGNEGWTYNDNVNSPLMKAWLAENGPVDGEDLERHD